MTRTAPSRERLASPAEAAEYASLSTHTIRRYINEGVLPAWRHGRKFIKVSLDDLDKLLLTPVATVADSDASDGRA